MLANLNFSHLNPSVSPEKENKMKKQLKLTQHHSLHSLYEWTISKTVQDVFVVLSVLAPKQDVAKKCANVLPRQSLLKKTTDDSQNILNYLSVSLCSLLLPPCVSVCLSVRAYR